ncbi:MAG TPA: hypothetical protein VMT00_12085 [Thermoanaerobaculia bacterium]|nr:hypothetical protein [Thermoanaerobaculia bacterium]
MRRTFPLLLLLLVAIALPSIGAETAHGEEHHEPTYFGMPAWILKLVNLILFVGLLSWVLKGPLGKAFRERRENIQTSLAEAKTRRERADRLADDIQARMEQLERDVAAILERAREEGERQKRELIAATETEAAKILASAKNEVAARVKMARSELTSLAGEVATTRAVSLLRSTITEDDQRKLFEDSLREVEEMPS